MGTTYPHHSWRGRWILTAVLLLLALLGCAAAADRLPRTYQSESSVVLVASRAVAKQSGGNNPYLSFSPSLTLSADVLIQELMAPSTVSTLASHGDDDPYTVTLTPETIQTTGSVIDISVTGNQAASVQRTLLAVIAEAHTRLDTLQAGLSPYRRIRMVTLSISSAPSLSVSQTARPLVILATVALAAAFGIPWLLDAQITRRRIRRMPHPEPGASPNGYLGDPRILVEAAPHRLPGHEAGGRGGTDPQRHAIPRRRPGT